MPPFPEAGRYPLVVQFAGDGEETAALEDPSDHVADSRRLGRVDRIARPVPERWTAAGGSAPGGEFVGLRLQPFPESFHLVLRDSAQHAGHHPA